MNPKSLAGGNHKEEFTEQGGGRTAARARMATAEVDEHQQRHDDNDANDANANNNTNLPPPTARSRRQNHHHHLVMEGLAVDCQTLEERKRNALAHALRGGAEERDDDKNNFKKATKQPPPKQRPSGRKYSGKPSLADSQPLPNSLAATESSTSSILLPARPQPNYPPASELIFGTGESKQQSLMTTHNDVVQSSSAEAKVDATTVQGRVTVIEPDGGDGQLPLAKRKVGKTRKSMTHTTTTNTTTGTTVARKLTLSSTSGSVAPDSCSARTHEEMTNIAIEAGVRGAVTTSTKETGMKYLGESVVEGVPSVPKRKVGRPRKKITPPLHSDARNNTTAKDDANINISPHDSCATDNIFNQQKNINNTSLHHSNDGDMDVMDSNTCDENNHRHGVNALTSTSSLHPLSSASNLLPPSSQDDEYARFMRSIIGCDDDDFINERGGGGASTEYDDQSILTFKTLQSIREGRVAEATSTLLENTTLDEDDFSYQLTSEGEEEEDDDDDEEEDDDDDMDVSQASEDEKNEGKKKKIRSEMQSPLRESATIQPSPSLSSPMLTLDDDEELLNILGEIEDLMEEDLEFSLIGGSGFERIRGRGAGDTVTADTSNQTGCSSLGDNKVGNIVGALQKQMAVTTPGVSTKKKKSTTTVVTTPPQCINRDRHAIASNVTNNNNNSSLGVLGVGGIDVPPVTTDQMARLRVMMAHHHQLLLQQATLSVRAAYVHKVRKDGLNSNAASATTSEKRNLLLPESRLETKSLTFISKPVASECSYVNDFFGGETPDELSECLDGSVGMLQDLEQNWKDAVRKSIQLAPVVQVASQDAGGARQLKFTQQESSSWNMSKNPVNVGVGSAPELDHGRSSRRLTRSALTKTLLERDAVTSILNDLSSPSKRHHHSSSSLTHTDTSSATTLNDTMTKHPPTRVSVFDIRGLSRLKATFSALDNSVKDVVMGREKGNNEDGINVLAPDLHGKACEILLQHARAEIDTQYLPGGQDLGACLTHAPEAFDEPDKIRHPLTKQQEVELRKNRYFFTAGEDNLILRGVNLYGEKEWCLVSDRFLPDRVFNSISQRYNKLCFLIYKANGIVIDDKGKLAPIPKFAKGESYDIVQAEKLKPAQAPTTMNVHRWTLEEDITILKAVPVMGNFWAEICTRLIPHRDRGHVRKRFQVLQRRIPKGVTKMNLNYLKRPAEQSFKSVRSPKRIKVPVPQVAVQRSPSTKKKGTQKNTPQPLVHKSLVTKPPAPAHTGNEGMHATVAASAAAASPARIFQLAEQVRKQRPPMSPEERAPPLSHTQFLSNHESSEASFQNMKTIKGRDISGSSPEAKIVASALDGFSQSCLVDENSQLHVEKILGDDWSQASKIGRLISAGNVESNFVCERFADGMIEPGHVEGEMLPMYRIPNEEEASRLSVIHHEHPSQVNIHQANHGVRKSILSSVMEKTNENANKRKNVATLPSTPAKLPYDYHTKNASVTSEHEYHSTSIHPTTVEALNLGTPTKEDRSVLVSTQGEATMNQELFEYFMSEKSRCDDGTMMPDADAPSVDNMEMIFSPAKTNMMMSPIKIGKTITDSTPLSHFGETFGSISGPLDGENSLLLHSSVFDAASALKDLSASNPNTPSKLLRPREGFLDEAQHAEESTYHYYDDVEIVDAEQKGIEGGDKQTRKTAVAQTSFFGKVKARLSSDNMEERRTC